MTSPLSKYGHVNSVYDLMDVFNWHRKSEIDEDCICAMEKRAVPLPWAFNYAAKLDLSLYIVPRKANKYEEPFGIVESLDMFGVIIKHHRETQEASIDDIVSISSLSAETLISIEQSKGYFGDAIKTLYAYGLDLLIYPEQARPITKFDRYSGRVICIDRI